ncbi:hypothetical protein AB0904_14400 [Streptomyces sp. NPDC006684]|uniref:hypothetical protein n=1 Tax=Streptomyces sp. NPDC006684 TaxID=3154477 RepID=UPI003453D485
MNLRGRRQRDEEGEPGTPAAPGSRRPRGATTLLLVAAAVLGLGGGTAYGYHVQADRHPKPLPPLAQSGLSYPKKALPADAKGSRPPLEENQDHQLVYRGGLDRLLLPLPKGWRQQEEGERTYGSAFRRTGDLLQYELEGDGSGWTLQSELVAGISRIAGDDWSGPGELSATIRLVDYAAGPNAEARAAVKSSFDWVRSYSGFRDLKIRTGPPGTHAYFWKSPPRAGYAQQWGGRVIGSRGSVHFEMTFWDDKPLDQKMVLGFAKKQWERV